MCVLRPCLFARYFAGTLEEALTCPQCSSDMIIELDPKELAKPKVGDRLLFDRQFYSPSKGG